MDLSNQEIKYYRELSGISFSFFSDKNRKITINVNYINPTYKITINDHSNKYHGSVFNERAIDKNYKLYTKEMDVVVDLVMSYYELHDNLHADLWASFPGEKILSIDIDSSIYKEVENQIKRMLNLCTNLYIAEYKHHDDEKI